jgi:Glutaredoxin-like domain (DUF836)
LSRVVFYGKAGCHLCDEALVVVERVRGDTPFDLRLVDVSLDPVLDREYGERVPVVAVDGEDLGDFFVDESELRARLARVGA